MFVYWLTRRRFVKSFEPSSDGYLFRPYPWSEAHKVSEAERNELQRRFRGKYFKYYGVFWLSFFAVILGGGILAVSFGGPNSESILIKSIGWVFAIFMLGTIFAIDRRLQTLPRRELLDRPIAQEPIGLKGAFIARSVKLTWTYIAIWLAFVVALGWLFFPSLGAPIWAWALWVSYFALCAASLALHIYAKVKFSPHERMQ
jgi:hypothetical protein